MNVNICCCSFGMYAQLMFEKLLQSTGRTFYTMITQTIGAVINIVLDPILIFGWFGMLGMGVMGAAIATVFGQMVAAVIAIIFNMRKNKDIKFKFGRFKPEKTVIWQIYAIGFPAIIMQAIGSVMTYGMNHILLRFSFTAVATFGVYYKLQSFIFMPVFGLSNGTVPIISYNYGARKKDRLVKTIQLSIVYAAGIMLIGFVLFQMFPQYFLYLFDALPEMLQIGIPALRIISISYLFAGFCIICGSVFQALGNAVYGLIVAVSRQLVVLLPAAYFLAGTERVVNVWWTFPIAEIASLVMTIVFLLYTNKKIIGKMETY